MTGFPVYTIQSAPERSKPALEKLQDSLKATAPKRKAEVA